MTHQATKTWQTKIIVRETREIHRGTNPKTHEPYTIWQIIATKVDGTPIGDMNLRAFDNLPRGETLTVKVTPFHSEQYGTSYTVQLAEKTQTQTEVERLTERVRRIEERLGMDGSSSAGQPLHSAYTSPPPPPPTAPPNDALPPLPPGPQSSPNSTNEPF